MNTTDSQLLEDITEVSRKRTVINAISNYGQYGLTAIVGIFLQAYIIRTLGKNEYALWPLIQTCMGFVALIPIGIGSGAARFLAHALGSKNLRDVEEITTSLFFALVTTAIFYTICIICLSVYFEKIFDIPEGATGICLWAMLLTGLSGAVAMPFGVFQGGLRAAQKFVIINILRIVFLIVKLILIILVFTLSIPSLIWVGGIYLALEISNGIATFLIVKHVIPWNRVRLKSFNWKVLWKVNNFSLLVLISNIAALLYWKTDNIIINKLLEPSLLTGYSVVVNFVLYSYQFTSLGIGVLMPAATVLHAKKELQKIGRLLYRANRTVVPLAVFLLSFLIIFGKELFDVYLGPGYKEYAILFPILAGGAIISVTQNAAGIVPHAFGRLSVVSLMSLIVAIANLILSIFFVVVMKWGLLGVAAGTAIVTIIHKTVFWPWYTAHLLKIQWSKYFYESIIVPLGNCLPAVLTMLFLKWLGLGKGWTSLITTIFICGVVQATFMLLWGINKNDRTSLKEYLLNILTTNRKGLNLQRIFVR